MSKKQPPFRIIEAKGDHLVVSTPHFQRFVIHQFEHTPSTLPLYLGLLDSSPSNPCSLIPVIHHSIIQPHSSSTPHDNQSLRIVTEYYEHTLQDMMKSRGEFSEEQLANTMDEILARLKEIAERGLDYGMLSPASVCFHKDEIVLGFGQISKKEQGETYLECDLKALGLMILGLAVKQKGAPQELLQLASGKYKYSKKLVERIRTLVDPVSENRVKIWEEGTSVCPREIGIKKEHALSECNSYEGESFTQKIMKLNDMVDEYLKRSKRVIERSENNRMGLSK